MSNTHGPAEPANAKSPSLLASAFSLPTLLYILAAVVVLAVGVPVLSSAVVGLVP